MSTITLASIQSDADRRFGSLVIDLGGEQVTMLSPLRLPKERRAKLASLLDTLSAAAEGDDPAEKFEAVMRLVCATPAQGEALVGAIGGDLGVLVSTFEAYSTETQVGEASASES